MYDISMCIVHSSGPVKFASSSKGRKFILTVTSGGPQARSKGIFIYRDFQPVRFSKWLPYMPYGIQDQRIRTKNADPVLCE